MKNYIPYIIGFLISFMTPIVPALIATGFLIFIDTITGIIAARKRGEIITSKKLKASLIKMFLYQLAIITSHMIETYLATYIPFTNIVLGSIATVEFYSMIENVNSTIGGNLLKIIKDKMNSYVNKKIDK